MDLLILDRNNNILDRFSNKFFWGLKHTDLLNDISKGSFTMTIKNSNAKEAYLKLNNRIIFVDNWNVLFWWYIYNIIPTYWEYNTFYFQSLVWIFNDKKFYANVEYINQTIDFILNDIIDTVNLRENIAIDIDCWITDLTSKKFERPNTIFSAFQDLLDNKYEFIVEPVLVWTTASFTLKVKESIWIDRTVSWNDYVEYKYNLNVWEKRTINSIKWNIDIRNTWNAIIWTDWTIYNEQEDLTSIGAIWRIERVVKVLWDVTAETIAYLTSRKDVINDIEVEPKSNNYFEVSLWDTVKVITSWNKFMEFNIWIKVIWKTFEWWELIKIWIILNNAKIKKITLIDTIKTLKTKIENIKDSVWGWAGAVWGAITWTLSNQTDLQNALNAKQDSLWFTAENSANKWASNWYAPLVWWLVPSANLPSYVDDVVEVSNYASLPWTGETWKIYITIDDNKQFRWTGTVYVDITWWDVKLNDVQTLTNKRITQRLNTIADWATITPNWDSSDVYTVTGLTQATTINAPTWTPTAWQKLLLRIKDNWTSRALTWNAIYFAESDLVLPSVTIASKTMYLWFIYNAVTSKWDFVWINEWWSWVSAPADSGWLTPTYVNGWVDYDASIYFWIRYRKIWNVVEIKWLAKSWSAVQVFTLPVWYRPSSQLILPMTSNQVFWAFDILTSWVVNCRVYSNLWISLSCTFLVD